MPRTRKCCGVADLLRNLYTRPAFPFKERGSKRSYRLGSLHGKSLSLSRALGKTATIAFCYIVDIPQVVWIREFFSSCRALSWSISLVFLKNFPQSSLKKKSLKFLPVFDVNAYVLLR